LAIRTILFDLGKVIVDFDFDIAYRRMGALSGLEKEEMRSRLRVNNLVPDFEMGRIEAEPFVAEVNRRLGISLDCAGFAELWSAIFHRSPIIPESLLADLKRRHRLMLLSNTNTLHFAMIRNNFPHIGHFDALVLSHEVGALKPSAAIYQAAIAQAGCAPSECLFFDDLADNVAGARAAGMNAEQFVGMAQLCADLARFGIDIS
jgi:FMN phosphatase YigB (HAD superfamily)